MIWTGAQHNILPSNEQQRASVLIVLVLHTGISAVYCILHKEEEQPLKKYCTYSYSSNEDDVHSGCGRNSVPGSSSHPALQGQQFSTGMAENMIMISQIIDIICILKCTFYCVIPPKLKGYSVVN